MKLSMALTNYSWSDGPARIAARVQDLAQQADAAGLDTLWVADHLLQVDPNAEIDEPMLESYSTLAYLAGFTRRIRLGTLVTWATIRPPALLVKIVSTLDVLSGGRAWLGVGAGYQEEEAKMTGLPFAPTAERFGRLEELLELAAQMWAGDRTPFAGPYHRLDGPINEPSPLGRPRVLIGGMGERRTLPLVARHADACNLFDIPDGGATLRRKLEVLADACADVGRDPSEIEVSLSTRLAPDETLDQFVDRAGALSAQGVDHLVVLTTGPWERGAELDTVLAAAEPLAAVA
jgi:F420-dependent oxidoreductase-like protein